MRCYFVHMLSFFLFCVSIAAANVSATVINTNNFSFIIPDNQIKLHFKQVIPELDTTHSPVLSPTPATVPQFLNFEYRLGLNSDTKPYSSTTALAVFLTDALIYIVPGLLADDVWHQATVELSPTPQNPDLSQVFFYLNQISVPLQLQLRGLQLADTMLVSDSVLSVDELQAIREHDGSLTLWLRTTSVTPITDLRVFCFDEERIIENQGRVVHFTDFLWPQITTALWWANDLGELVVSVQDFLCEQKIVVRANKTQSPPVPIITPESRHE